MAQEIVVTLETLAKGAAVERFEAALREVLENIADPNTKAEAVRTITVTCAIRPDKHRRTAAVSVNAVPKLAPNEPVATSIYLARRAGVPLATEFDPEQGSLYDIDSLGK